MKKKLISVLCAVSMILAVLPAASAAEPVSKYAGQTISVQVVEDTEAGMVSRIIEVAIPAGATKSQETELIYAAAQGEECAPLSSGIQPYATWDIISSENYFTLNTRGTMVGGGTLKQKYQRIGVSLELLSSFHPGASISVQLKNAEDGTNSGWKKLDLSQLVHIVIFYAESDNFDMLKGTDLEVYAKISTGTMEIGNCTVQGSPDA